MQFHPALNFSVAIEILTFIHEFTAESNAIDDEV